MAPSLARSVARAAAVALRAAGLALVVWAMRADAHWAERHVLASYCATDPLEAVVSSTFRWIAGAVGVSVMIWAPTVVRGTRRAGGLRAQTVLGIVLAVTASLAVGEAYVRRLHDRIVGAAALALDVHDRRMARPDPRLGWAYVPERITWADVGGRSVRYAIDRDGDRAASPGERPDPTQRTILFAGESIAFGYGLQDDETLSALVGRDLGVQTVNLAVIGYGNDQAYLRVADALRRFTHPVAVVTVFLPDQVRRNVDRWRPHLGLGPGGALVRAGPSTGPRLGKLLDQLPFHGDEALQVTAAILRASAEAAWARGAFPLFVVTNYGGPCAHDAGAEAWVIDALFVRQGLPFVRVDLGTEDRLPGWFERHPNARAVRRIAAAVEGALPAQLRRSGRAEP